MDTRQRTSEQTEKRAAYLRSKIERAQAELESLGQPSTRPATGPRILVATPTHTGGIEYKTAISLMNLAERLRSAGIPHEFQFIGGSSIITLVRNYFANRVAFDTDRYGQPFDALLFIDSDVSGFEDGIVKLIDADLPIAALAYSLKAVNWKRVARAVHAGVAAEHLPEFAGEPVLGMHGPIDVNKFTKVSHAATGAMLIQAKVLRALAEAHKDDPKWRYRVHEAFYFGNPLPKNREHDVAFFQMDTDPQTGFFRSEDYFFCDAARELGFETHVLPNVRTQHTGSYSFALNMPALAAAQVA